jgi:hypothetical protein
LVGFAAQFIAVASYVQSGPVKMNAHKGPQRRLVRSEWWRIWDALRVHLHEHCGNYPSQKDRGFCATRHLASLNHPNIAHIYGVEDSDSTHGLIVELVAGPRSLFVSRQARFPPTRPDSGIYDGARRVDTVALPQGDQLRHSGARDAD